MGLCAREKKAFNVGRGSIPIHQVMQRCQNCTCINQKRQELTPQRRRLELKASGTWTSCSTKPVNVMTYDMQPFLQSCNHRYQSLADKDAKPFKTVATPFHEERIARPLEGESAPKGALAPMAARVLMKILFAARMARYDLLTAVQGLAARVTKWSADCEKALHRLICYSHSTLDYKLKAFVGDGL